MLNIKTDEYINQSQEFAKPILMYLRRCVHAVDKNVEEQIKWGFPCFSYNGKLICSFASFKNHCAFTFWQGANMPDPQNILQIEGKSAMGHLGKIKSLEDLPNQKVLLAYLKKSIEISQEKPTKTKPKNQEETISLVIPSILKDALINNKKAKIFFEELRPSHKKEFIQWIQEAKQESTKLSRLEKCIVMLCEKKTLHWKYNLKKKETANLPVENAFENYFSKLEGIYQERLLEMRFLVKELVPEGEEYLYYQMPAMKFHGVVCCYASFKKHLGFYPCDVTTINFFQEKLKDYSCSKGAIQLPYDKPLPKKLIQEIIKYKVKEKLKTQK